ncbi:hypothetical protein [Aquabacter spiritensis]|uniref:Uncharacterized protein n=1 Tax=Aquabacter spiritensis TaxID=933073 RepID=A0A4R3M3P0_9HYPH|nr:hypothetical protein [Aquabacter spiritensis]TCT07642.1 hypothetical protein EDC64_101161 [Aquabacter spiritensis]
MGAERRTLRLVEPAEAPRDRPAAAQPKGADPAPAPAGEEPAVTPGAILAALVIGAASAGVSWGFFHWLPLWVHLAVFGLVFAAGALFGRRIACS